ALCGAHPCCLAPQGPPSTRASATKHADTPLFSEAELETSLAAAMSVRAWLAQTPDDSAAIVREKERALSRLDATNRWKDVADVWCACWMWPDRDTQPDSR